MLRLEIYETTCAREAFVKDVSAISLRHSLKAFPHEKKKKNCWKLSKNVLKNKKNVIVKQIEKKSQRKYKRKIYSTEKSAKEYFWIFHLMFQANQENWSSIMFSYSVYYNFCWGLFYICVVVFCSFHRPKFVFRIKTCSFPRHQK